jgi:hypothetical protein
VSNILIVAIISLLDIIHRPVFILKTMDNVQKTNNCINMPSSQTFRSYPHCSSTAHTEEAGSAPQTVWTLKNLFRYCVHGPNTIDVIHSGMQKIRMIVSDEMVKACFKVVLSIKIEWKELDTAQARMLQLYKSVQ